VLQRLPVAQLLCGALRLAGRYFGQQRGSRGIMRQVLQTCSCGAA
jgi:hypothetical protein